MKLKTHNFIERTILNALAFFKESLFAQVSASKKGFLQSLDPRLKAGGFFFFLLALLFSKNLPVIAGLYILCLLLALSSKVSLGFFLKRTLFFIPLFSLFISLPAFFVSFARQGRGLFEAVIFLSRITAMSSFVILLGLATGHAALLKVLRIFRVPQVFILTLSMGYRYIYLLAESIEQNFLAVKSRIGGWTHQKNGGHIAALKIASLWRRSYQLNNDVYDAMLSRGYTGEPVVFDEFRSGIKDWFFLCLAALIFLLSVYYG